MIRSPNGTYCLLTVSVSLRWAVGHRPSVSLSDLRLWDIPEGWISRYSPVTEGITIIRGTHAYHFAQHRLVVISMWLFSYITREIPSVPQIYTCLCLICRYCIQYVYLLARKHMAYLLRVNLISLAFLWNLVFATVAREPWVSRILEEVVK